MKTNKSFREYFNNSEFNNFKNFIMDSYKATLVASPFESFLIINDGRYIHELKFDIDFDNEQGCEATNIINTAMLLVAFKAENVTNNDKYYEETIQIGKITKKSVRFGKVKASNLSQVNVTYTKRNKYYQTYETMVHDELIRQYVQYSA